MQDGYTIKRFRLKDREHLCTAFGQAIVAPYINKFLNYSPIADLSDVPIS